MNSLEVRSVIDSLRVMIAQIIDEKMASLPVTIPCKVLARDGVTVSVKPLIVFGDLTPPRIEGVPIAKSPYINAPIKANDIGMLVPCSYFYSDIVTDDKEKIDTITPTVAMGNYVFLPLSRASADYSAGTDTELWSKGGASSIKVADDKIVETATAIEMNGNSKVFVTGVELQTALTSSTDTMINAELAKIATVLNTLAPGAYVVTPVVTNIASAYTTTVKTGG